MNELNYPFDPDFILKKRKSLKRALKAPGGGYKPDLQAHRRPRRLYHA